MRFDTLKMEGSDRSTADRRPEFMASAVSFWLIGITRSGKRPVAWIQATHCSMPATLKVRLLLAVVDDGNFGAVTVKRAKKSVQID